MITNIKLSKFTASLIIFIFGCIAIVTVAPKTASALSGSDFKAGRIIDDTVFYNSSSMTVPQIQEFLNSKVPICDTNGTKPYASTTRAAYGTSRGYPPPYTCLKDYSQTIPTITNGGSDLCKNSVTGGTKSAAQIIYDASVACGINPQTLIVLLQKEQSLITDDWPWSNQYRSATGYGCPDTAPCDAEFYGFFNQVYQAAKAFRRYEANPNSYNYKANRNNNIYYNPNLSGCGSSNVFIENQATASLYIYTPYQPNASALNNLYGTGDSCGAYGNRNFWRMFNDWFGSTYTSGASFINSIPVTVIAQPQANPAVGQEITYVVSFKNNLSYSITFDGVGVVGRGENINTGDNRDFGWQGPATLAAGASRQFTFTTKIKNSGNTFVWPAIFYQGNYMQYNNWGTTIVSHPANFTLSQPLTISHNSIYAGQNITFSAVLKNNEPYPINYDAIGIPIKFYDRYSYDAIWVGPGIVAPGAEIHLSAVRNIDKPGPFTYWVSNSFGGNYTTIGSVRNFTSIEPTPNFSVSGLNFNSSSPALGQSLATTFTVTNNLPVPIDVDGVGVIGRLGTLNGANRDIHWQGPVRFEANETKTFTGFSRNITDVGNHYYWIGVLDNNSYIQYNNWGSTVVSRAPSFSVSGLTLNTSSPAVGGNIEAAFTITNNLPVPIDIDGLGVVGRFGAFNGLNRDIDWRGPISFTANETKTFTAYTRTISDLGTHYYWIGVYDNGGFIQYNNWGSTVVSRAQ